MRIVDPLYDGWSVRKACKRSGYGRTSVYERRASDPALAAAWDDAVAHGTDTAMERTINGSENLLVFLLRARRPSMYRENAKAEAPSHITVAWSPLGARPDVMDRS